MGEIADMMIDGDMCQSCGVWLGGGDGFARFCRSCEPRSKKEKKEAKSKDCAAPDCLTKIPTFLHACEKHWTDLPKKIRGDLVYWGRQRLQHNEGLTKAQREAREFWKSNSVSPEATV